MYFRSIDVCQYYAKRVVRQYGNYGNKYEVPAEHRVTSYCKPVRVNPNNKVIYDRQMSINRLQNGVIQFNETLYDATDIINDGRLYGFWVI